MSPPDSDNTTTAQPRKRLRAESLADGVVILLCLMVVQRAVGFGRGILFCRWLSPAEMGVWGMLLNFLLLAAPLAVLGLPGSFGRYLEHYRQRGQLRTFLRRTAWAVAGLASLAVAAIVLLRSQFSQLIFGQPDQQRLVLIAAGCLAAVVMHHFLESLFTALRASRVTSSMQFCQSVGFAVLGAGLLWFWGLNAISVLVAYGAASLLSAIGAVFWLRGLHADSPAENSPIGHAPFWRRLLPFTAWIWVANLLANLFAVVDRAMLVHCGRMTHEQAMEAVGYYQSSLIVPLLLVGVADLLGSLLTPHLSHDWEAGRRDAVSARLNLAVKLVAVAFLAAGVLVLAASPLLFGVALAGRYDGGLAVLPWTMTYCIWFGIAIVVQNYLWCAEKARLCSLTLLLGLAVNVGLNLLLVPRYGLAGAVLGTAAANFTALGLSLLLSRAAGMKLDLGTWLLCAAPLAIGFGLWPALFVLALILTESLCTTRFFTLWEKQQLIELAAKYLRRAGLIENPMEPANGRETAG